MHSEPNDASGHATVNGNSTNGANSSSWAARNPGQPIIPPRSAPPRPDPAHIASRKIASKQKQEANDLLHAGVKSILQDFQNKIAELAVTHNVSIDKIQRLVGGYQNYAPSRKPQLVNALVHAKAKILNQDRPSGSKYSLQEIRELLKEDPDMRPESLDPIQAQQYIDELVEHRELQKHGMRASNTAAAKDMYNTLGNVFTSLDNLVVRTGGYAIVFATRGHVNDTAMPTWHGTHNAMDFFEDKVCANTELSTVSVTGKSGKEVSMNYDNYDTAIVKNLHVKLVGWPKEVPFSSPSKIYTVGDMRTLRDALKYGDCHWVTLSAKHQENCKLLDCT
ncbi:hypothetical protein BJ138DRAFT_1018023 [Hygrophoropsis aurantiaca]|uniref:Uncharacterized protein n=1 Tax=Hygrophoropsis aurantiaca TaxID=72124 RepID=A0ACB7ZW00_9AGAM|nr:hypothetical protein BJ138DRAFT_1018023 [Hygrophoropsis aurantiaca]